MSAETFDSDARTCCSQPLRFDPDFVGKTVGGLELRGADVCDVCGAAYLVKARSIPTDGSGTWTLAKGGRSVVAGSVKLRAEKAGAAEVESVMARVVRVPELEREVATLRDAVRELAQMVRIGHEPRRLQELEQLAEQSAAVGVMTRREHPEEDQPMQT